MTAAAALGEVLSHPGIFLQFLIFFVWLITISVASVRVILSFSGSLGVELDSFLQLLCGS